MIGRECLIRQLGVPDEISEKSKNTITSKRSGTAFMIIMAFRASQLPRHAISTAAQCRPSDPSREVETTHCSYSQDHSHRQARFYDSSDKGQDMAIGTTFRRGERSQQNGRYEESKSDRRHGQGLCLRSKTTSAAGGI